MGSRWCVIGFLLVVLTPPCYAGREAPKGNAWGQVVNAETGDPIPGAWLVSAGRTGFATADDAGAFGIWASTRRSFPVTVLWSR